MVEFLIKNNALAQLLAFVLMAAVIIIQAFTIIKLKRLLAEAVKTLKDTLNSALKLWKLNDELINELDNAWVVIRKLRDENAAKKSCGKNCCKNKKPKK